MKKLSALAVAGVLALAGCGGDDSSETETQSAAPATTTEQQQAEASPASGDVVEVAAKEIKFLPEAVTVKAGQTVKWTNEDPVPHNVVAEDESFKSENFNEGESYEFTFEKAGTYPYVCTIHPGQKGTVTVQ